MAETSRSGGASYVDARLRVLPGSRGGRVPVPSSLEPSRGIPGNGATNRGGIRRELGGGLYFNYAFTAVWIADALWWWRAGLDGYRARSRWVTGAVHLFFGFMFFNATVVFGSAFMRWFGVASMLILAVTAASRSRLR